QMDLTRRSAAGELSELLGPSQLDEDLSSRRLRLRAIAQKALDRLQPADRAFLSAYAEGVTAGVAALNSRPPEYLLLRQRPQAWLPEDSILVLHSMGL